MCAESNQYDRVCKGEFAELNAKLDRLDEAIRGNGKPGLQLRLDRLEQDAHRQGRLIWLLVGAAITLAGNALGGWLFGG